MKRPDQVLARARINACLAPDRAVDLRQKACRDLNKADPAPQNRGGKANQIANHPAAQSDHYVAAFDLLVQQPVSTSLQLRPTLCALARRQFQRGRLDPPGY